MNYKLTTPGTLNIQQDLEYYGVFQSQIMVTLNNYMIEGEGGWAEWGHVISGISGIVKSAWVATTRRGNT